MFNLYKKEGENFWFVSSHSQSIDAKEAALRLDAQAYIVVGQDEEGQDILELDASKFEILSEDAINPERIKPAPIPTMTEIIRAKAAAAMKFGDSLIEEIAAENIGLGISQAGKTKHVRKASQEVTDALWSGSLYDAIDELRAIPEEDKDAVFLSDARILATINKIETFLQLPHSSSL